MSRHVSVVTADKAAILFNVPVEDMATVLGHTPRSEELVVKVAHGYDAPMMSYFCDLMPDCELGIYYGGIGLTTKNTREEYAKAMYSLGLMTAGDAVLLDIPY